jgi:hypothetical protein
MSIKVQMTPIWRSAPFDWGILAFGLSGPGRAPGCLCPAVTALPGNPLAPGRGWDLTEAGQFFLTPGEQRSGRGRLFTGVVMLTWSGREDAACGQDGGTVLNRSVFSAAALNRRGSSAP